MEAHADLLLAVSNALLVPVVVLLLAMVGLSVLLLGGFAREALERRMRRPAFRKLVHDLRADPRRTVTAAELPQGFGLVGVALPAHGASREKVLDDLQILAERTVGRLHMAVRLGPILGLAGTLVPLGPALVALSSGDIATLSSRLVVAFTTTVLGLLVGGVCFVMQTLRRSWYVQDLNDVEFVFSRLG